MRIWALIIRIISQFLRDRRTLALLIIAPLLVLSLMYLVFNGDEYVPGIGAVALPDPIVRQLTDAKAEPVVYADIDEAEEALGQKEIDAYITLEAGVPLVKLEGSDPAASRAVLARVMQLNTANSGETAPPASPHVQYLHGGEEMTTFDSLGPVFIGVFAFFFVFLIAGVSFLKERTSGTLERLLATPLRRWEIVIGYLLGFGIFAGVQAALIASYSIHVLGLMMNGSIGLVLLVTLLLAIAALSLGTFLSALAHSEFQLIQFIPIVIVPQVFFSGMFDLESMSPWIRWLAHLMPLKYGANALRDIMIRGEGWGGIAGDVCILVGFSLLFLSANVLALRKHRKI